MTSSPAIQATTLTKRYGSLTAVAGIDLTIPVGQVVALLGPNGAGKSTTTEMILGLTRPDDGSLTLFGRGPAASITAGDVGALLQNGTLLADVSVGGLLRLMHGLHAHPLPLGEVIERARLADILRTNTTKLSGGQAQRVRFALAIMPSPRLLLLDEPTVGFDVDARRHFWSTMAEFAADGRTVLFATHYLDEADEFADRIVVMDAGRIVADGTGAQIKGTVAGRVVSFAGPDADYARLPGVATASRIGERHALRCTDSDAALRALMRDEHVSAVEVTSPSLEDAFLNLVG